MSQAGRALAYAFETGALVAPEGRTFLLRAEPGALGDVDAEQSLRPEFLRLQRAHWKVVPRLPLLPDGDGYGLGLVLLTKHKEENFANIARAWDLLAPGGMLASAGANEEGAASLEKGVGKAFDGANQLFKFHSRVFWFAKGERAPPDYWRRLATLQPVGDDASPGGRWQSQPGLFSWDRIDDGSALLAQHLPNDLAGSVADFGCGWGFLARHVLAHCPGVTSLDCIDAEHRALEAAEANVVDARATFHWLDLVTETAPGTYDAIVCNPPFHSGRAATPSLGQQIVEAASRALKPGGRLYMVANRGLPYEPTLKANFTGFETLADNNKFKITKAVR